MKHIRKLPVFFLMAVFFYLLSGIIGWWGFTEPLKTKMVALLIAVVFFVGGLSFSLLAITFYQHKIGLR